jgi:hypothetical protein
VRLLSRLRQVLSIELSLSTLFAQPTLIGLAEAIGKPHSGPQVLPPVAAISRDGYLPLSFAQQRLWFLAQLEGVSATYHIPQGLRLRGSLNKGALRRSLDHLYARHEALRSVFVSVDGQPEIRLLSPELGIPWHEDDLKEAMDAEAELRQLCIEEAHAPFDLVHGPLIRSRLIRVAEEEHVLLVTQHHIVSDGWSTEIFVRELNALYSAFSQGQSDPLLPLAIQYPDYAAWQRQWLISERLEIQASYWRETLADAPVLLELPTDRPRPAQQSFAGARVPIQIDAELTRKLKQLSQKHGTTLFISLLSAWAVVLARLSGQQELVIGTPTANRGRREIEDLIGFFVNTLALRIDLSGELSVEELLSRVRDRALGAQDNQDIPFEQVVEIAQPPRRLDYTPLFQVMFAWQGKDEGSFQLPGLSVEPVDVPYDIAKFDLDLELREIDGSIVGSLGYSTALFDPSTIERHKGYLLKIVEAMVADPSHPVTQIELLDSEERELLINSFNQT